MSTPPAPAIHGEEPEAASPSAGEAPPAAPSTAQSKEPAAPERAEQTAQRRPAEGAGVDVLATTHRESAPARGEALPAPEGTETPDAGEASLGVDAPPQGAPREAAPSPVAPPAADRPAAVAQEAQQATGGSGENREQQTGGERRRPEERLASGVRRLSGAAPHERAGTASETASRGNDLEPAAPSPTAPSGGGQDGVVAPAPSVQQAPFGAANAPQLTARAELGEMIDAIHATIELAARRGATQARIALQPEELGEIRIHLSQSAEGIVARLTAATPAAAQALAAGRGELHQSLSSLGATLLQLDIGTFEGREGRRHQVAGEGGSARAAGAPTEEDETIAAAAGATPAAAPSGPLGTLVDVLA